MLDLFALQILIHSVEKSRHFLGNNLPEDVFVDTEVGVDQDVTQAGDLAPLDVGNCAPRINTKLFGRLSNYHEVPNDGIVCLLVAQKSSFVQTSGVLSNLLSCCANILDEEALLTRHRSNPLQFGFLSEAARLSR